MTFIKDELEAAFETDQAFRSLENPLKRGNIRLHVGFLCESIQEMAVPEYMGEAHPVTGYSKNGKRCPNFIKWLAHYSKEQLSFLEMPNMQI